MKCWVLLIERNRGRLLKRGEYTGNAGLAKTGFFKKVGFNIPDRALPIEIEQRRKTIPLWIVDGRTLMALGMEEAEVEKTEKLEVKDTFSKEVRSIEVPIYKKKAGMIAIYPVSDPTTYIKQNVLMKGSFYDAILKKLKISLIATIIYMCAGGGLFLLALYLIKIIFLKESTI